MCLPLLALLPFRPSRFFLPCLLGGGGTGDGSSPPPTFTPAQKVPLPPSPQQEAKEGEGGGGAGLPLGTAVAQSISPKPRNFLLPKRKKKKKIPGPGPLPTVSSAPPSPELGISFHKLLWGLLFPSSKLCAIFSHPSWVEGGADPWAGEGGDGCRADWLLGPQGAAWAASL